MSRTVFKAASYLHGSGMLTVTALAICFFFSWLASQVGLAPIVGAFAAGLILEKVQYRELAQRHSRELEELMRPLADLLVPIFFVMMGVQVDLRSFADPKVLGLAAVLFARCRPGQAGLCPGRARTRAESTEHRRGNDSPRRGGVDLRRGRTPALHRRPARRGRRHLLAPWS